MASMKRPLVPLPRYSEIFHVAYYRGGYHGLGECAMGTAGTGGAEPESLRAVS